MTLKHGKFYNGIGEVVPLEFGNQQQIDILNRIKALKEGVLFMDWRRFNCICGSSTYRDHADGERMRCRECHAMYEFYSLDDIPYIKLIEFLNTPNK